MTKGAASDAVRFAEHLRQLKDERQITNKLLASRAGINASYVTRILNGEREAPSYLFVEAIARALGLSDREADDLFADAGYIPPSIRELGWLPVMSSVAQIVYDQTIPANERRGFEVAIETLCRHWKPTPQPDNHTLKERYPIN